MRSGLTPWFSGKRLLAKRLAAHIEAIAHRCYDEPFIGMGAVCFGRFDISSVEMLYSPKDARKRVTELIIEGP